MTTSPRFDWKAPFLAALRQVPVLVHACEAVGINRSTAYRARQADDEFATAWDDAIEDGVDNAEREAFRRGVVGFEEPVIHKGSLAYVYERYVDPSDNEERFRRVLDAKGQPIPLTVRKHSDLILSLILKGRRKKVYADRTELTGPEGGVLQIDETGRTARVAQLMALAAARKAEQEEFGDLA